MKTKYTLFLRGGIYYSQDSATGQQKSLRTRDEAEAFQLVNARNESHRQPVLNLHLARAYLTATPCRRRASGARPSTTSTPSRSASRYDGTATSGVGSYQQDAVGKHQHETFIKPYGGQDLIYTDPNHLVVAAPISAFPQTWGKGLPTGFEGKGETRPKNAYVYYIIKY
jgi:hypothetical protein